MLSPNGPPGPRDRRYSQTRKSTKSKSILALLLVAVTFAVLRTTAAPREVVPREVVTNSRWPSPPAIQAASAAVAVNGRLVLDLNGQIPRPFVSTAKIMTAYLALKSLSPADHIVVTSQDIATTAHQAAEDGVEAPILVGEQLTVEQGLQALLLPSANNASVLLAERTSSSEAAFVDKMNAAARQMRLTNAHFADSSGLDDGTPSAADMVSLTERAMEEPSFLTLVRTQQATFPGWGTITNRNQLLFTDPLILGGKTGNTRAAGDNLILISQIRGEFVVPALLGEPSWTATYSDGRDILSWAQRALAADAAATPGATGGTGDGTLTIGRPSLAMSLREAST